MGRKGYKLVRGIGINDADYDVVKYTYREDGSRYKSWECPFYSDWTNMLTRCTTEQGKYSYDYAPKYNIAYANCGCYLDWLYFSKFRAWAISQEWEGNHLDKDLIGDGTYYSPNTCVYIPVSINSILTRGNGAVSGLAFGVGYSYSKKKPFQSSVKSLGIVIRKAKIFHTELEAHKYWIEGKIEAFNILINKYEGVSDKRILEGLRSKIYLLQNAYNNDILVYKL